MIKRFLIGFFVTLALPLIVLIDWTFCNLPLQTVMRENWQDYCETMGWR